MHKIFAFFLTLLTSLAVAQDLPANFKQVNTHHWSAGHFDSAEQVQAVADLGIEVVISLLPSSEAKIDASQIVTKAGMIFIQVPIAGANDLTKEKVQAVTDALALTQGKNTLIHCASGNRVGAVMALKSAWVDSMPVEDALKVGQAYGLSGLNPLVQNSLQ